MDILFEKLAALSPKERTLFHLLLEERRERRTRELIPRAPRADHYPLSSAQQRLWFLNQLEPAGSFYNIPLAVHLRGALNHSALERSLREVVDRHSVMRATFALRNGEAVQTIRPVDEFPFQSTSLEYLPECERVQRARDLVNEETQRPFTLSSQLPVRAGIFKIDDEEHVLLINMHHIVCDGWSVGILIKEVATLYDAFCSGKSSPLEDLPLQYTDFAVWQKTPKQTAILDHELNYWKQHLGGRKITELSASGPTTKTFRAGRGYSEWPRDILEKLKMISRDQGATLFMTLLAAFQTLLYYESGQDQVLVGTPTAGRSRTELEPLIGCFVNTLVMQTDLSGNPTFRDLLGRVKKTVLGAFVNQDVPFEKVVAALHPERTFQQTPIFKVWFVLQNAPLPALELQKLTLRPVWASSETSKFDLMLSMQEEAGDLLTGIWRYNRDLFKSETITALLREFQVLVESIAANPDQRLGDLRPMENVERGLTNHPSALQCDADADASHQFNF